MFLPNYWSRCVPFTHIGPKVSCNRLNSGLQEEKENCPEIDKNQSRSKYKQVDAFVHE